MSATKETPTAAKDADVRTYRGASLQELLPRIRAELGEHAVVLREREGLMGGVGGFFQKQFVEIDARAGTPGEAASIDVYDDGATGGTYATPAAAEPLPSYRRAPLPEAYAAAEAAEHDELDDRGHDDEDDVPVFEPFVPPSATRPAAAPAPDEEDEDELPPAARSDSPAIEALLREAGTFAEFLDAANAEPAAVVPAPLERAALPGLAAAENRSTARRSPRPAPGTPPPAVRAHIPASPAPAPEPAPESAPAAGATRPTAADTLAEALVAHGVGPRLADDLVAETVSHLMPFGSPRQLKRLVRVALARRIPLPAPRAAGGRVVAFVGAGGAGKTLISARLAAAYAQGSDLPVVVVALRAPDGGEELRGLLADTAVTVLAAADAASAAPAIAALAGRAMVIVDAPAVSPRDEREVRALARDLKKLGSEERHLALPATLSTPAARELLAALAPVKPTAMALTHADETDCIGGALELAIESSLPVSYLGRGSDVLGGLQPADPATLAAIVVP